MDPQPIDIKFIALTPMEMKYLVGFTIINASIVAILVYKQHALQKQVDGHKQVLSDVYARLEKMTDGKIWDLFEDE